jgi:hypothetical protein
MGGFLMHEPEQIKCPKYPDHGIVRARFLPPEEREMVKATRDVYEADCPHCGRYEFLAEPILLEIVGVE